MDSGPIQYPRLIRAGHKDCSGLLDSFQDSAVSSSANALRRQQPNILDATINDHRASLLKPVADEVGLRGYSAGIDVEKRIDVVATERSPQEFSAKEWWVAHDCIGCGPRGLAGIFRV